MSVIVEEVATLAAWDQALTALVQLRGTELKRYGYLLCGDRDPRWLGVLGLNDAQALDFPSAHARCVQAVKDATPAASRHHACATYRAP